MICVQRTLFLLFAAILSFANAWLEKQCGCFSDWVQCDSGECIPQSRVCDKQSDCRDESDEQGCSLCPSGFTFVSIVKGCYAVVLENLEWALAGLRCKALHPDAHLLIINKAEEQEAIKTWMSGYSDTEIAGCARYDSTHGCKEMFWTAGQRYDLERRQSPFVWKQTPGTGSCCTGTCMEEMKYTNWSGGEPNNHAARDADLNRVSPPLPEKCMQLCRGWYYKWNDALCEIPTCSICEVDI